MKTGTDISLTTCRQEGYAVVAHSNKPMDPDGMYELTISEPRHWPNGRLRPGTHSKDAWAVNCFTTYVELWKSFLRGGDGIKSFCDFKNCPFPAPTESPGFSDFASLAGIVNSYHGITEGPWI